MRFMVYGLAWTRNPKPYMLVLEKVWGLRGEGLINRTETKFKAQNPNLLRNAIYVVTVGRLGSEIGCRVWIWWCEVANQRCGVGDKRVVEG